VTNKKFFVFLLTLLILFFLAGYLTLKSNIFFKKDSNKNITLEKTNNVISSIEPTPTLTPTPTPTPKPLTFSEMNSLYGPCVYLPTLMYHHVQDMNLAKEKKQTGLTVDTETFKSQMQYLKEKGYQTIGFSELINFFDSGTGIAKKTILITFDDGYDDFYLNALPILKEYGFKASVFIPTGLMNNAGYMIWEQIIDANNAGYYFGNHTWSHKNVLQEKEVIDNEITLGDKILAERGLNNLKVFAYPYGFSSSYSEELLSNLGYKLAFTTKSGSTLCKKLRFELPRIRIGNISISSYGF